MTDQKSAPMRITFTALTLSGGAFAAWYDHTDVFRLGVLGVATASAIVVAAPWPRVVVDRWRSRGRAAASFTKLVPALRAEAITVAMRAASTAHEIAQCAKVAQEQAQMAESIESASVETTKAIEHVSGSAQRVAASAEDSVQRATLTAEGLRVAGKKIAEVDDSVQAFLAIVQDVNQRCGDVASVMERIASISRQTKILALNAAIEAAHAGDRGKGFAAVAQSIRELAEEVSDVTGQSQSSVKVATALAADAAARSAVVRRDIGGILAAVRSGSMACNHILNDLRGASAQFSSIAAAAQQMAASNMQVRSNILKSKEMSLAVTQRLGDTSQSSAKLLGATESIQESLGEFEVGGGRFELVLKECRVWQVRLAEALIQVHAQVDIFDKHHVPVAGTNPPQVMTAYQPVFEKVVRPLLDGAREATGALACTCTSDTGYLPTHNTDMSWPPSGDFTIDIKRCRDKRIMTDRHGQRSAQYQGNLLLQTFVRDNGDLTAEIALPLHVAGRRWGAVRFGFDPSAILQAPG